MSRPETLEEILPPTAECQKKHNVDHLHLPGVNPDILKRRGFWQKIKIEVLGAI